MKKQNFLAVLVIFLEFYRGNSEKLESGINLDDNASSYLDYDDNGNIISVKASKNLTFEAESVLKTTKHSPKDKIHAVEITSIEEVAVEPNQVAAHNKYDTTDLLINCCNIGTYMQNCSDSGIDNTMVNPPIGLCRSTIKHCCMLSRNDEPFDFKCDPKNAEHLTCCAVCKVAPLVSETSENFKMLVSRCCATVAPPQPLRHSPCKLGYMWNESTQTCDDIDECRVLNNGCCESQDCVNTQGSYHCVPHGTCRLGYRFNEDILECQKDYSDNLMYSVLTEDYDTHVDATTSAADVEHPVKIQLLQPECQMGYRYDEKTGNCLDIDECQESPCQHFCTNTDGSYKCHCRRGFKANGDDCEDVDECQRSPCSHQCTNVVGSYRCHCPHGMVLGIDKKTCNDKNLNASCPQHFKVYKTPEDKDFLKCVRVPCGNETYCKSLPKYVTYKSLTIPRNFKIPERGVQIFNIKTKSIKVEVDHNVKINNEVKPAGGRKAEVEDFVTKKEPNRLLVLLVKPLDGPQIFSVSVNLVKDKMKIMESVEIRITIK